MREKGRREKRKKMAQERKIPTGVMFLSEQKRCASRQLISKGGAFLLLPERQIVEIDANSS